MNLGMVGMGPSAVALDLSENLPVLDGCWGCGPDPQADIRGCTLLFDCHDDYNEDHNYKCKSLPIITQEDYPIRAVIKCIGRDYFGSTFGYMLAYALLLHQSAPIDSIQCWGMDMDSEGEYINQRPNVEWLIGLAEGRGIKVDIGLGSSLTKYDWHGMSRYCWEHLP